MTICDFCKTEDSEDEHWEVRIEITGENGALGIVKYLDLCSNCRELFISEIEKVIGKYKST